MMIDKPATTGLIFESGKLMCLGAKSEHDSRTAARRMARIISKLPVNQRIIFRNFQIKNVVGKAEIGHTIDHIELGKYLNPNKNNKTQTIDHEPRKFKPQVIDYRMESPVKVQMKIFRSGKVTIFGCKSVSDLHKAWNIFTKKVSDFTEATARIDDSWTNKPSIFNSFKYLYFF